MKNIQILVTLKAQVETADFMMEDLATRRIFVMNNE